MKIGILTFHCAHNYGAVLQCYATQEFLRSQGHEVEVINYRPKYLLTPYRLFDIKRFLHKNPFILLKLLVVQLLMFPARYKRFRGFENFIKKRLKIGQEVTKNSIPSKCDAYIIGSDQVWNSRITKGFDPVYFADFAFKKGKKKYISYAASMEASVLNQEQSEFYSKNLGTFDAISVREYQLQKLLQPLTTKRITHVLDPTLMVPSYVWNNLSSNKPNVDKYVVVYQVACNENTLRIANHLAKQIGAKVKVLVAWLEFKTMEGTNQIATPEDFVDTIRNAACVVTTSFHGTAFSIIFRRPFYTIKLNEGWDTRSSSLLDSLGLSDRLIGIGESPIFTSIDYSIANKKLEKLQFESQNFLLSNL